MLHFGRKVWTITVITALAVGVVADGKITSIQFAAGQVELTVRTSVDESYQIQCCTNLVEGSWIPTGVEFIATNSVSSYSIEAPDLSCYFRVVKDDNSLTEDPVGPPSPPPPPPLPPGQ